jgi:hypothetical protein
MTFSEPWILREEVITDDFISSVSDDLYVETGYPLFIEVAVDPFPV